MLSGSSCHDKYLLPHVTKFSDTLACLLFSMLLQEIKSGQNVQVPKVAFEPSHTAADLRPGLQLYRDTLDLIGDKLGPAEQIRDNEWMDKTQV